MESKIGKYIDWIIRSSKNDKLPGGKESIDLIKEIPISIRKEVVLTILSNKDYWDANYAIPNLLFDLPSPHDFSAVQVGDIVHSITECKCKVNKEINEADRQFIASLIDGCENKPESLILELISFHPATSSFMLLASRDFLISKSVERKFQQAANYFFEDRWMLNDTDRFFIYNEVNLSLFSTYLSRLNDYFADELMKKLLRNGRFVNIREDATSYSDAYIDRYGLAATARKAFDLMAKENLLCPDTTPALLTKFKETKMLSAILGHFGHEKDIAMMMLPHLDKKGDFPELDSYIREHATDLMISASAQQFNLILDIIESDHDSNPRHIEDYLGHMSNVLFWDETRSPAVLIKAILEDESIRFGDPESLDTTHQKIVQSIKRLGAEGVARYTRDLTPKAVENLKVIIPDLTHRECASLFPQSRRHFITKDIDL